MSSNMRRFLPAALGLFLAAATLQAQDALTFTQIDRNPVTSAFAGAGSASMGNTAWSAFSNASVLPFYDGTLDASVSYQNWMPGLSKAMHVNAGVAYKVTSALGLSVGYALQKEAAMDGFRPTDQVIALGVAYGLGEKWALGVNGRFASQRLTEEFKYSGFSGDAFVAFQPSKALRLTAGVSTLGTKVDSYSGYSFRQPASAKVAADWCLRFADALGIEVLADAGYFFSGEYGVSVGAQLDWDEMVFLRGGYRYASEGCAIPGHVGLGAGIKFLGIRLDVSFLAASPALGNTLCAGLGYSF